MALTVKPYRLAALVSHPIQYQAPLYRSLTSRPEIDLEVLFCSRRGLNAYYDPEFGKVLAWDVPLVSGYKHRFLPNLAKSTANSGRFTSLNPGIVSAMLRERFDAVWLHGWGLGTNLLCWAAARAARVPILLRAEATGFAEPAGFKGRLRREALAKWFGGISGFLPIGAHNREFYRGYGIPESRMFTVPYAVDNASFLTQADAEAGNRAALKSRLGIDTNLPAVLFMGKLIDKKRPLDLLQAFGRIAAAGSGASLVFVGDGALRERMERFVAAEKVKGVHFAGFKNQSEIGEYYALADVFVLPSGCEPWGLVVNEAMCFGLPVIASDQVGAAGDLVRHGQNGFVYPAGDVEALSGRLKALVENGSLRRRMGAESRSIIRHWGLDEAVEGIVNAVTSVCGTRRCR